MDDGVEPTHEPHPDQVGNIDAQDRLEREGHQGNEIHHHYRRKEVLDTVVWAMVPLWIVTHHAESCHMHETKKDPRQQFGFVGHDDDLLPSKNPRAFGEPVRLSPFGVYCEDHEVPKCQSKKRGVEDRSSAVFGIEEFVQLEAPPTAVFFRIVCERRLVLGGFQPPEANYSNQHRATQHYQPTSLQPHVLFHRQIDDWVVLIVLIVLLVFFIPVCLSLPRLPFLFSLPFLALVPLVFALNCVPKSATWAVRGVSLVDHFGRQNHLDLEKTQK
mmetsp:Transcript_41474/g.109831  ORF Transcript_41474/g.109831 Transcript_41474/m.109831 type:complete len:272 (-) Transcript_41474:234-1049(-)